MAEYVPKNFKPVPDRGQKIGDAGVRDGMRAVPGYYNAGERSKTTPAPKKAAVEEVVAVPETKRSKRSKAVKF